MEYFDHCWIIAKAGLVHHNFEVCDEFGIV